MTGTELPIIGSVLTIVSVFAMVLASAVGNNQKIDSTNLNYTSITLAVDHQNSVHRMSLRGKELRVIPEELHSFEFPCLTYVDLSDNQITDPIFPTRWLHEEKNIIACEQFGGPIEIPRTYYIDLSKNGITAVPDTSPRNSIYKLNLSDNQIRTLKKPIYVRELYLKSNQVFELPKQYIFPDNLQELDLSENFLTEIPEYREWQSKDWLEKQWYENNPSILNLSKNKIVKIPPCVPFEVVRLAHNILEKVPPNFNQTPTCKVSGLYRLLDFSHNRLSTIAIDVKSDIINISGNRLTELPESLHYIEIDASHNEINSLVGSGPPATDFRRLADQTANKLKDKRILNFSKNLITSVPDNWVVNHDKREDLFDKAHRETKRILILSGNPIPDLEIRRLRRIARNTEIVF